MNVTMGTIVSIIHKAFWVKPKAKPLRGLCPNIDNMKDLYRPYQSANSESYSKPSCDVRFSAISNKKKNSDLKSGCKI